MLSTLFDRNSDWAEGKLESDPGYFDRLSAQQSPEYFWIGCADSRVPANVVCGLEPGEVFVHRNVANVIHSSDLNMLSALEYAVDVLKVKHIIVCGHYGCGGVHASVEDCAHGLVDHWLEPIRRLADTHVHQLVVLKGSETRLDRLAELNVIEGVRRLCQTPILRNAWQNGSDVAVHGLIYGLKNGHIRNLDCSVAAGLSVDPSDPD
jgi:carbonic anhydrase